MRQPVVDFLAGERGQALVGGGAQQGFNYCA
jgi:hypothetical protein